ncbi:MAG: hypothetical protein SPI83_00675 [Rothia sp. (in: high G+C Gram-positive bacteria)]|nr:hypothetical protein [Rothia sp. (in: high G+C Gram-positive bacteria)]
MVVAQRIGTAREADKILVLDKGRLVGSGSHTEPIGARSFSIGY